LGVLPRHAPLITRLVDGPVTIHQPGGAKNLVFGVASGFLEVKPDRVTVLADAVELSEGDPHLSGRDAAVVGGEDD
jgi:F-type H+-transporting ATPase subunit epsilon